MSHIRSRGLPAVAGGLLFLLLATPAAAQDRVTIRGRVADASDNPIAAAVVLLHAIGDDSGREVTRDTADDNGAFELAFAIEEGALYFVATRVEGNIFMSEPFRDEPPGELVLRAGAGVEPLQLDGMTPGAATQPVVAERGSETGRALVWVLVIGAAVAGLVAWVVARGRRRAPRARELLLELARLDEAHAASAGQPDATYRARRDELRGRLAEALALDPDADRH